MNPQLFVGSPTGIRFTWTIDKYSHHYLVTGEKLKSSIFHSGEDHKDQWRLEMYPKGQRQSTKNNVSIYLRLLRTRKPEIKANVKFEILKPGFNCEPVHSSTQTIRDLKWSQGERQGISEFVDSSELEAYVKNDTLQLFCAIDFAADSKEAAKRPARLSQEFGTVNHRLTDDLWLLFSNRTYSDTIITVGNHQFYVHSLILKIRSPALGAKLPDRKRETGHYDEILLDKTKPEIVQKMLHFMYTDRIENFEGMMEELLEAADRYEMQALKTLCVKHLCGEVNVQNAADILIMGEKYNAKTLMNYCARFINLHLPEVIETQGFKSIEENYPELGCFLIRRLSEEMVVQH
ncbi:speckle-type POZ protein-like [Diachasma alloeum]|uniref:speckle-type POZ protein-like n=1 Tax=Diachasma alloeum TaxID=454923 RepID=UPI0010FB94A4|nr:speckle-type POZ protein-like [Diachasma alloeum]